MAKLDYQKAIQLTGKSDQEIRDFAKKNNIELYNLPQEQISSLSPLGQAAKTTSNIVNFLFPAPTKAIKDIGETLYAMAPGTSNVLSGENVVAQALSGRRKAQQQPRRSMSRFSELLKGTIPMARLAAGAGTEIGVFGGGVGKTLGQAAGAGAFRGGAIGVTDPRTKSIQQALTQGGLGAGLGAAAGAAFYGVSKGLEKLFKHVPAEKVIDKPVETIDVSKPGNRARLFSKSFTIPTKRAKDLRPLETSKKMAEYGIHGNFEQLAQYTDDVTGANGVISKATRDAIGAIPTDVDANNVTSAVSNIADNSLEIDAATLNKIQRQITSKMKPGTTIGTMNPLDAFDLQKQLEGLGHQYLNRSTYLTGNIRNEQIGKLYLAAAQELADSINQAAAKSGVVANLDKTAAIAKLTQISPKLAQEFAKASTVKQLRSLQAPFVRLGMMIDLTEQAQLSAANKVGTALMTRIFGPLSFAIQPVADILGAGAQQAQTPLLTGLSNIAMPKLSIPGQTQIPKLLQILGGRVGSEAGRSLYEQ